MLCYVIWLFVKRLSQEAIQRRSQHDRLVKIKVFKLRRDADDIPCNIKLRSAGGESMPSREVQECRRESSAPSRKTYCPEIETKDSFNLKHLTSNFKITF